LCVLWPPNAVTGQRPADNRKSDFLGNEFLRHGLFSAHPH